MPYAIDGRISQDAIEGGVEITDEQYQDAIQTMIDGGKVTIVDGALILTAAGDPSEGNTDAVPTEAAVRAEGARRLALIGQPYSSQERETWPQQVLEAKSVSTDAAAVVPLLTMLAAADGVSVTSYAALVLSKAATFSLAAGAVLAAQRVLIAADPIPVDFADDAHWP